MTNLHYPLFPIPHTWVRALRVVAMGLLLGFAVFLGSHALLQSDPYSQAVIALEGCADRGESLFMQNCAACHGLDGYGRVGPSLKGLQSRRSDQFIIEQVTSGNTPPMPQFQPDPQSMADLLSYLKTL